MINQRGFSLVEVTVASLVLAIVAYISFSGISTWNKQLKRSSTKGAKSFVVNSIESKLKTATSVHQVDYSDRSAVTSLNELSMGWAIDGTELPYNECGDACVGKFGAVVKPLPDFEGLYIVTIKITESDSDQERIVQVLSE